MDFSETNFDDDRFMMEKAMEDAIRLALNNVDKFSDKPFGAVVTYQGKILTSGSSKVVTNNDPTAHAEIIAIRNAIQKLDFQSKLSKCNFYLSCEPCTMCLNALHRAGV